MSLLAVNCVLLLHWALEAGWEALPSPKWAAQWEALLACSPCLGRCSAHQLHVFMDAKCRSASAKPKPASFQWVLTVQTTKRWHWCSSACWMSLWELMKPRNSRGEKDRKKWGKREARQKEEGCDATLPRWCWAVQPSLATRVAEEEVTVTSPAAELLPGAWPGL